MTRTKPIGVLGLQGDFDAHRKALEEVDETSAIVRRPDQLGAIDALIIPGGESTTLIKLMLDTGFVEPLRRFRAAGSPIYGTCAGAILLAARVRGPEQFSLGFIDIDIERNAYGRQRESFETALGRIEPGGGLEAGVGASTGASGLELVMIRAPRIRRCGPAVRVLVRNADEPVLVQEGPVLAGTFHPELGRDRLIHRYFSKLARQPAVAACPS